jgi:hypothetical protein
LPHETKQRSMQWFNFTVLTLWVTEIHHRLSAQYSDSVLSEQSIFRLCWAKPVNSSPWTLLSSLLILEGVTGIVVSIWTEDNCISPLHSVWMTRRGQGHHGRQVCGFLKMSVLFCFFLTCIAVVNRHLKGVAEP